MSERVIGREVREIGEDQAEEFIWEDGGRGWRMVEDEVIDKRRWHVRHRRVIHLEGTDTYWEMFYDEAATENQEDGPLPTKMYQVWPHLVSVTKYRDHPEPFGGAA